MTQQHDPAKTRSSTAPPSSTLMRTRRGFIKQVIASSAVLAAVSNSQVRSAVRGATRFSSQEIRTLQERLTGGLVLPDDAAFETARRVKFWNPLTDKRPAMVARCAGPEDVARCLEFAQKHQLAVAVRSGGHSFLGWGTCDEGFVLDVGPLKK